MKIGVLGTFESPVENSALAAAWVEKAGWQVIRIHRDDPWPLKVRKLLAADVLYGTGFGFAWKLFLLARAAGRRTINHWMGTDVLLALEDPRLRRMARLADRFIVRQLAQAPWLATEIATLGIRAEVLTLVTELNATTLRAAAAPPGVLAYLPDQRPDFYGGPIIYRLAEALPELPFGVVAGTAGHTPLLPNLRYYGWVDDMGHLYDRYPILVRVARHDGLPKMVLEALARGNQVIFEYEFPHCYRATSYEEALAALRVILSAGCPVNRAGHDYVMTTYSPEQTTQKLLEVLSTPSRLV